MQQLSHQNIRWLNIAKPEFGDLRFLESELGAAPSVIHELMGFNKRPKIEEYGNYLFLVMHFPVFSEETRQTAPTELDFIVSANRVVTVYQNSNPVLKNLFKQLDDETARKEDYFKNAGFLLFSILDRLIDSCLPMLDHIHEKIDAAEQQVFDGQEQAMLKEIAILKRDIIDFRRTMKPQLSVLELLAKKANRFFGQELDIISQEIIGSEVRVWNTLENHKEMIEAIEKTNESLLSYQISRVMHTLTFFSIILFSLTFIAGFFSMRVVDGPLLAPYFSEPILVFGAMITVVLIITAVFKKKRWI